MSEEREEVYQILELGKHLKNLHHKKGFGGLLFIDLSMIKFSKLSSYIRQLDKENEELKRLLEEKNKPQIFIDTQDIEERYAEGLYQDYLEEENKKYKNQQKEFINYLEDEKDRLARGCSHIYEDSLGRTRLVNEDIFNEVDTILSKYKEIIGEK